MTAAVATVTAITLLIFPLKRVIPPRSLAAFYIPAVLLLTARWDVWTGLLAAVLAAFAFDYFHIPPVRQLTDLATDGMTLLAASLGAIYVAGLGARARSAEERRRQEVLARARVVAAADEERRRVVRDLHDGAQQRLVHAVIELKLATRAIDNADPDARDRVEAALEQAEQANVELRELAHGILPSTLTRGGLRAGIKGLAARMMLPVAVDVPDQRLPPAIEASAYFVVSEALTNVAKHAQATSASVSASVLNGQLYLEVSDDGVGGASGTGTTGLAALEDRVSALDGRLVVQSPKGEGTRVSATLPLPEQG